MHLWSCVRCFLSLPYSTDWSFLERIVAVGSYCSNFGVVRACLAEIPLYSFDLPFPRLTMRTPLGLSRPPVLRIGGSSAEESDLRQIGEGFGRPAIVVDQVPLAGPPSLSRKGKRKVSEIRYLGGSNYLRAVLKNAEVVGPNRIEPFFGKTFATRYRPPFGVYVWCLDFLTSYIVQVPKMVCFFEAAFENGLRFPIHPFIKSVLQHFNVFPSHLSPNFLGVLVGLLIVFRDKGIGVPSITFLLDFFSVKEAVEGFLYISKSTNAKPIILNLSSSHKH